MGHQPITSIETDVLVIGGGVAGSMAGIQVTIVEKSNTVASGCAASGIDHIWAYIPRSTRRWGTPSMAWQRTTARA